MPTSAAKSVAVSPLRCHTSSKCSRSAALNERFVSPVFGSRFFRFFLSPFVGSERKNPLGRPALCCGASVGRFSRPSLSRSGGIPSRSFSGFTSPDIVFLPGGEAPVCMGRRTFSANFLGHEVRNFGEGDIADDGSGDLNDGRRYWLELDIDASAKKVSGTFATAL